MWCFTLHLWMTSLSFDDSNSFIDLSDSPSCGNFKSKYSHITRFVWQICSIVFLSLFYC
uniref:Uncharacterized protein n=1 Tax=Rhizophora mucronata TaxID=61149 RepID=A0A2P2MSD3_RHIMU